MKKRGESYLPFVAVSVPIGLTILLQGLSEIIKDSQYCLLSRWPPIYVRYSDANDGTETNCCDFV